MHKRTTSLLYMSDMYAIFALNSNENKMKEKTNRKGKLAKCSPFVINPFPFFVFLGAFSYHFMRVFGDIKSK